MDPLDSIHDDLMEVVLSHLVRASTQRTEGLLNFDAGEFTGYDEDLLKFAATSKRNRRLVFDYLERWYEGDELEIFFWNSATRASPNLPPLPGYKSNGYAREFLTFSRSTACAFAAASGNLDMLKCLRRQGYPWDDNMGMPTGTLVTARAAAGGHVKTHAWACENGCASNWTSNMWFAVAGGHIEMMEYLIGRREPDRRFVNGTDVSVAAIAVTHGHLHVLEWMWKQPFFVPNTEFRERAIEFRERVIEFACEAACDAVIDRERFEAYNWLREAGCEQELTKEWDRQTLAREYIHEHYGQFHTPDAPKTYEDYSDLTDVIREAKRKGYHFVCSRSDTFAHYAKGYYFKGWPNYAEIFWHISEEPPPKPWNMSTMSFIEGI